ncbi:hypothetical protein K474DRAFT_1680949, partial [Panus rudis PR-1116 ss-1]
MQMHAHSRAQREKAAGRKRSPTHASTAWKRQGWGGSHEEVQLAKGVADTQCKVAEVNSNVKSWVNKGRKVWSERGEGGDGRWEISSLFEAVIDARGNGHEDPKQAGFSPRGSKSRGRGQWPFDLERLSEDITKRRTSLNRTYREQQSALISIFAMSTQQENQTPSNAVMPGANNPSTDPGAGGIVSGGVTTHEINSNKGLTTEANTPVVNTPKANTP